MKQFFQVLAITILYLLIFIYANNTNLVNITLFSAFPLSIKFNILVALVLGIGTSMNPIEFGFLFVIALLTGINFVQLIAKIHDLRSTGSMKILVGGSSLLGIVSTGCASCGLPLLVFFGLGGSLSFLPMHGFEFTILTLVLLSLSLIMLFKQKSSKECPIQQI